MVERDWSRPKKRAVVSTDPNPFRVAHEKLLENDKLLQDEKRCAAIRLVLNEYRQRRDDILRYPELFTGGQHIARERRVAVERIEAIMDDDWKGE